MIPKRFSNLRNLQLQEIQTGSVEIFIYSFPYLEKCFVFSYKTMTGSSQYRFGVLAKIVKHMKTRHQEGDEHPLTIEEILDETNQLDIGNSVKNVNEYLKLNLTKTFKII